MNKRILFACMISALLVGCGGSGSGSSNGGSTDGQTEPSAKLLTADDVEEMTNSLTLANQLHDSLVGLKNQPKTVPFLVRLNEGNEATLASQGPLLLNAKCDEDGDVSVLYRSSSAGTLAYANKVDDYMTVDNDYVWESLFEDGNAKVLVSRNETSVDRGILIAASGDTMLIDGDAIMYGTDVQGSACFVAGLVTVMKGEEAGEFSVPSPF